MDSTDAQNQQSALPLLRPLPRRLFQASPPSASPITDTSSSLLGHVSVTSNDQEESSMPPRSRSIQNLTSSTLLGIYAPSSFTDATSSTPPTPWGTGAETPSGNGNTDDSYANSRLVPLRGAELEARLLGSGEFEMSQARGNDGPTSTGRGLISLVGLKKGGLRALFLFCFGLAYGGIVAHLHDNRNLAPTKIEGLNRASWRYLAFWGCAGVAMGSLLPWIDVIWSGLGRTQTAAREKDEMRGSTVRPPGLNGVEWNDVVRSVGAFIGIAFAIRKLPWSSPLQLSLTLALANPFLWYLLDRTTAGLTLSSFIGILGTASILTINPSLIPSPTDTFTLPLANTTNTLFALKHIQHVRSLPEMQDALGSLLRLECIGVATWIASVLFCSCVCFGNIGRLLVPSPSLGRRFGKGGGLGR